MAALEKVPPQNLEAEQSVLGAMLLERDAILKASERLQPKDFYRDAHRIIFEAIIGLTDASEAVDTVTLTEELRRRQKLEAVGGVTYLTQLSSAVPTAANVEHYARIVEDKAILRRLINTASEITRRAFEEQEDVDVLMDAAEQMVFDVAQGRQTQHYAPLRDVLVETFEYIEQLHSQQGSVIGIPSGFADFDKQTSGFHPSDLVIIAARPSMGKTTLALNMASHTAIQQKTPVALFSLEMSKLQLAQRLLCAEANVNAHRLRTGYLTDEDWPRLSRAFGRLSEAPIIIDDTASLSIMELRARARRLKAEHDVGLILVDYLQLMYVRGRTENRQQEISTISRGLKALARELEIPVVALSQLSRAVEQRQDHRPQLSDLRESGAIEQDADLVAFLHNNPEVDNDNIIDLLISKQRNGPTGTVQLVFLKEIGRFVDLERRLEE